MNKNKKVYVGLSADILHKGHINILKIAKEMCDFLVVGVTVDELVAYKNKKAVISFEERIAIIDAIKYVDQTVPQTSMDKLSAWKEVNFDIMFVGDDWKGTKKWEKIENELSKVGVKIVYFPYTRGTSSTLINQTLVDLRSRN